MLEEGVIEKIDQYSFKMHFIDDLEGKRMPGEKWFKKIDDYNTHDNSQCEVILQPNNSAKMIFTTVIINYDSYEVNETLIKTHEKNFMDFYNHILYVERLIRFKKN